MKTNNNCIHPSMHPKSSDDEVVAKMFEDGIISLSNISNWELFLSGSAKPKADYIRTVIKRYQKKVG